MFSSRGAWEITSICLASSQHWTHIISLKQKSNHIIPLLKIPQIAHSLGIKTNPSHVPQGSRHSNSDQNQCSLRYWYPSYISFYSSGKINPSHGNESAITGTSFIQFFSLINKGEASYLNTAPKNLNCVFCFSLTRTPFLSRVLNSSGIQIITWLPAETHCLVHCTMYLISLYYAHATSMKSCAEEVVDIFFFLSKMFLFMCTYVCLHMDICLMCVQTEARGFSQI